MYATETIQLNATFEPENATYKDINWSSSDSSAATVENGLISAKSVGKTKIIVTAKDGISKQCSVIVKEKPIEVNGSGDKIISDVNIPSGNYKAVLSNNGRSNFIVKFYESLNDSYGDLLANEIGTYNSSVVIRDGVTTAITGGMLEVKSTGSWTIKFERIITDINVGEIQRVVNIKNKGLRKSLKLLEELKYLIYKEYSNGMYTITLN